MCDSAQMTALIVRGEGDAGSAMRFPWHTSCGFQARAALCRPLRGIAAAERRRVAKLSGVVIVTGAASGLGREAAIHFADCGATVVAVDVNEAGLKSISSDRIHAITADVTRIADCKRVAERAAELGTITGLLNSAGIELHGSVVDPTGILNPGVKVPLAGQRAIGDVKYDPMLAPLPAASQRVLARVAAERAYGRSRLEMLEEPGLGTGDSG